jgi:fructan beta-fructosidase
VLYGGPAYYYIGEFDGKKFTAQTEVNQFNFGNAFYASQTFNDVPASDGRRVQIGWGLTPAPDMPFNQSLLFPVELTLHSTDEGIKMFGYPVDEIQSLYMKSYNIRDIITEPELFNAGGLLDIFMEFEPGEGKEFGLRIKEKDIIYDAGRSVLSGDGEEAELKPVDGRIRLRILVDTMTIEIFANDGQVYMPIRAYPVEKSKGFTLLGTSDTKINKLVVNELKSIWNK